MHRPQERERGTYWGGYSSEEEGEPRPRNPADLVDPGDLGQQTPRRRYIRPRPEGSSRRTSITHPFTTPSFVQAAEQDPTTDTQYPTNNSPIGSPSRGRGQRTASRHLRRRSSNGNINRSTHQRSTSPPRRGNTTGMVHDSAYRFINRSTGLSPNSTYPGRGQVDMDPIDELLTLPLSETHENAGVTTQDTLISSFTLTPGSRRSSWRNRLRLSRVSSSLATRDADSSEEDQLTEFIAASEMLMSAGTGSMKRSRDNFETIDGKDVMRALGNKGAVSVFLYQNEMPNPGANDVWPGFCNPAKVPARYYRLTKDARAQQEYLDGLCEIRDSSRPSKLQKTWAPAPSDQSVENVVVELRGQWPAGKVPTELFEEIAKYLDRDDIKSMRLVCHEFDQHIAQVLFKTVVVPFNTEIYGMLGQEQKPDFKGKKKVKMDNMNLVWKNANGADVYNGHGLDVFRGFGQHILRYGMSFEVTEDSLAKPPEKSKTESHTSFWGSYDWPFEEYRRFEDVAGLETAADETPRMKIAFSELTKVRELALSVNSGLGWLNGPDRSMRARILHRPTEVFGTPKELPDRRSQAQRELWNYIETCHLEAGNDVKHSMLYHLGVNRSFLELQDAQFLTEKQPEMPFLDQHLIHEAIPHDTAEVQVPLSFDDPEVLERFVHTPSSPGTGILFSSASLPPNGGLLMSSIIPASLTTAQKEWLLETEWAQRAFIASYMLSVIDNPRTFSFVHTLNISQLSDRYLPMFNRVDFWDSLPNLSNVNLQVIPGWRTVTKDEAGFVETPKISPSTGLDDFYSLLGNIISRSQYIKKLSFGWVTGGEHAEGLHARNKHILPAPILPADAAFEQDPAALDECVISFPNVEELTLNNCWMTPALLEKLVETHDKWSLKKLVLKSVSLTAKLRENGNPPQPNHQVPAGALQGAALNGALALAIVANIFGNNHTGNAQGAPVQQSVQQSIQNLQAQHGGQLNPLHLLQMHIGALQARIQQIQNMVNPGAGVQHELQNLQAQLLGAIQLLNQPPYAQSLLNNANGGVLWRSNLPLPNLPAVLKEQPREGSWIYVLDIISPGLNLSDFRSEFSKADTNRTTSLECIEFVSCGYVKLPNVQYDQSTLEPLNPHRKRSIFNKKYNIYAPAMLSAKWPLLGDIVQEVNQVELAALHAGWFLETGWKDAEEASGPEFDGLLPGGTGRFSGIVTKADRLD